MQDNWISVNFFSFIFYFLALLTKFLFDYFKNKKQYKIAVFLQFQAQKVCSRYRNILTAFLYGGMVYSNFLSEALQGHQMLISMLQ